ncbi:MAG TPA: menaquinone reductase multiheme cytochrome c subunit QrcA [Thermoanaerobaculia bacterium]|nr:menaquinone reductase multiheme cytochrome c subunit QrcA [Thermoanaerobaculia bacterium]
MRHRGFLAFGIGLGTALFCGWIAFPYALYRQTEQPIQFSHKIHTGEKAGLTCEECHALTAEGRLGLPKLDKCAPCHSEPQGKTTAEKLLVDRYVSKGREVPWLVYARQPENVYFSHAPHIKLAQIKCERCHGPHGDTGSLRPFEQSRISTYSRDIHGRSVLPIRRTEWGSMTMDDCSRCHRERGVQESCLTCHK